MALRLTYLGSQPRLRSLAAASLASVLALTSLTPALAADSPTKPNAPADKKSVKATKPIGRDAARAAASKKATIQKSGSTKKAVVKKLPATKSKQVKKPTVKKDTAPVTGGGSGGAQAQAQAQPAARKATILSNLPPNDFFSEEINGLGVEHVLILGQYNMDPAASTTAKVNGEKVVAAIKAARGENPSGWVMLDYEVPFDEIFDNGPTDPRYNAMVQSMIEAVRYAKAQLPNCKFTYYGVPNMRYWIPGGGWEAAPQWSQIQTMDSRVNVYRTLVAELDWLNPCLYDRYDATKHPANEQVALANREKLFRNRMVELADRLRKEVGKPDMPILPGVSLIYEGGGTGTVWQPLATEEFLRDQVEPALASGADGFFVWSSLDYQTWLVGLSWVPTPGEAPRANAREIITKLFYDGTAPASWTTPDAKIETRRRVSNFLAKYAGAVRSAESSVVANAGGKGD